MLDLLTVTRDGRLAILELKADEDLHFPLAGIGLLDSRALAAATAQLHREGRARTKRILSRYLAAAPLTAVVLHRARIASASFDGNRAAAPLPGDPWTLIALNEDWRKRAKSDLSQARRLCVRKMRAPFS